MANLRIVRENLAKTATLTATSEAGSLVIENVQDDRKSVVWRSTANTAQTITVTFSEAEFVDCVVLPFCSLTSQATMQVKLYTNAADVTAVYDSGAVLCCENVSLDVFNWGAEPLGVNAYSVGAYAYGRVYTDNHPVEKVEIIINDANNPNAYIEAGGLIVGSYDEFEYNPGYGSGISPFNTDKTQRTNSGDLIITQGNTARKLALKMDWLKATDRDIVYNMLMTSTNPVFLSLFPESADATLEQQGQLYGRVANSGYRATFYANYATNINIEEI